MVFDSMSYEVPGKRQRPQGFWRFRFWPLLFARRAGQKNQVEQ
jgi:hypothetical protein